MTLLLNVSPWTTLLNLERPGMSTDPSLVVLQTSCKPTGRDPRYCWSFFALGDPTVWGFGLVFKRDSFLEELSKLKLSSYTELRATQVWSWVPGSSRQCSGLLHTEFSKVLAPAPVPTELQWISHPVSSGTARAGPEMGHCHTAR